MEDEIHGGCAQGLHSGRDPPVRPVISTPCPAPPCRDWRSGVVGTAGGGKLIVRFDGDPSRRPARRTGPIRRPSRRTCPPDQGLLQGVNAPESDPIQKIPIPFG